MSVGCLRGVWKISGGCLKNAWRVSEGRRVSGECLEGVWGCGGCMEGVYMKVYENKTIDLKPYNTYMKKTT